MADAVLQVVNGGAALVVAGADLIAPYAADAESARDDAQLAADIALASGRYYSTRSAAEAGSTTGQLFVTNDGAGNIIYYERTSGGSVEIGRAPSAATLTAAVTFQRPNGGLAKPIDTKASETISVRDFGAIGDGAEHPLSERYATLALAQADFPAATALSNLIDGLAIQKALAWCSAYGQDAPQNPGKAELYIPAGRYRGNTGPYPIPSGVVVRGDGPERTYLDQQNTVANYPIFTNQDPGSFYNAGLHNLSVNGGTIGFDINVTGEVAGLDFRDVTFDIQSDKNFTCNKTFQTTNFRNVHFLYAPYGFYVPAYTTNAVNFFGCRFEGHSQPHVTIFTGEGINFYGCGFEAGALPNGRPTLDFDNVGSCNFYGGYFESTQAILLKELTSRSGVAFHGVHFTGANDGNGNFVPYQITTPGVVTVNGCEFGDMPLGAVTGGGAVAFGGFNGDRSDISAVPQHYRSTRTAKTMVSREKVVPTGLAVDLISITRAGSSGASSNLQQAYGRLFINYGAVTSGGFKITIVREFRVMIQGLGFNVIGAEVATVPGIAPTGGDVTVNLKNGASLSSATLTATFNLNGADPTTLQAQTLTYEWESIAGGTASADYLQLALA